MLRMGKHGQGLGRRVQHLHVSEGEGTSDKAPQVCSPKHFNAHTNPQSLPAAWAREASPTWKLPWLPQPGVPRRAEPTHILISM